MLVLLRFGPQARDYVDQEEQEADYGSTTRTEGHPLLEHTATLPRGESKRNLRHRPSIV